MQYAIARTGQHLGSFPEAEVWNGLAMGQFSRHDLAWTEGMPEWRLLGELFPGASPTPVSAMEPPKPVEADAGMRLLIPVGRSGWAIAAGYLGLFSLAVFPAPIAVIVSIIAIADLRRSKREGKKKYGMGRAVFGLVAGLLGTFMILYIAVLAAGKR